MSKPSRRPTREARKEHTQKRREAQRCLRAAQVQAGVVPLRTVAGEPVTGADVGGVDVPEHVVERVRSLNE